MTLLLPTTRVVGIIFKFCVKNWPIFPKKWSRSEVNFRSYDKKGVFIVFAHRNSYRDVVVSVSGMSDMFQNNIVVAYTFTSCSHDAEWLYKWLGLYSCWVSVIYCWWSSWQYRKSSDCSLKNVQKCVHTNTWWRLRWNEVTNKRCKQYQQHQLFSKLLNQSPNFVGIRVTPT